jgi:beta-galactosidase/beta-glucuronidase
MGILLLANFSIAMNDSPRIIQTINNHWTFNYFPHEKQDTRFKEKSFDDSKWQAIAIPHTWQTYETTGDVHPFISSASERDDPYWWHGWGWYRKHFIIPDKFKDKKIFIEFDGVQKSCDVWINGQKLGSHQGGFTTFYFDLTQHIRFGQKNIIAVAVSNRRMDPFRTPPMTAGNWNVYGGIYRDVRLVMKEKVHIPFQGSYKHEGGTFITTPVVNDTSAKVHIQTWVKNEQNSARDVTLISTILDSSDQIIAQIKSTRNIQQNELAHFVQESANIECPHLWSPENPYVYQVVSQVYVDDTKLDQMSSPLGFRWFWWNYTDNRLYLNGEPQHIHGTCLIPDYPWLGEAMPRWLLEKDLYDIRYNLNHNAIRPHVATAAPYVYDWCDRHGLLSVEEVPNFKRIDFSEQIQKQMTLEMIRRDRNHPSIFMWSVGNETTDASDTKWVVEQDTTRIVHARNIYNDSAGDFVDHTGQNMNLENLLRCTVRGWTHKDVMDLEPEINQHTGHEEHQHRMARIMGKSQRGRIDMISGLGI